MFWFDSKKLVKLVTIPSAFSNSLKQTLKDRIKNELGIDLSFKKEDAYLLSDKELDYINIIHDVCEQCEDIDALINKSLDDELVYQDRKIINIIGSFGTIELVENDNQTMVRKKPNVYPLSFAEEYRLMDKLFKSNPDSFIKVKRDIYNDSYLMEQASDSLFSFVTNKSYISTEYKFLIILSIINAVSFIHEIGIIHNDLHPENILLIKTGESEMWKISDFGLAYNCLDNTFILKTVTHNSRCTDYIRYHSKRNEVANDIYSIGKIINFIMTKRPNNSNHQFGHISKKCISKLYSVVEEIKYDFELTIRNDCFTAAHSLTKK